MVSRPKSATSWTGPFLNILKLEESRAFDNTAVVGGLDKFTQRWSEGMKGGAPQKSFRYLYRTRIYRAKSD